ncbi:hypothetical protein BDV12DRAFT_200658 [Aspergillus spectabilis]
MLKTYLDIVKECDNFPYYTTNPEHYKSFLENYYAFKVSTFPSTLGHVPRSLVPEFVYTDSPWEINHDTQELILSLKHDPNATNKNDYNPSNESTYLTTLLASSLKHLSTASTHPLLTTLQKTWRNEPFPIHSPEQIHLCNIERSASALFGLLTTGVQLTCYTTSSTGLKLWIARRSRTKQTYPGMLDSTAAGGLDSGLAPFEGVVRETVEEASLSESFVREKIRSVGALSYYHVMPALPSLNGIGLLQPEIEYVYEMELEGGVVPIPGDSEVEKFYLWGVEEVKGALGRGEFKFNSAIVVVDFFVRHGVITAENEGGYFEILSRLHRRLGL